MLTPSDTEIHKKVILEIIQQSIQRKLMKSPLDETLWNLKPTNNGGAAEKAIKPSTRWGEKLNSVL